MSNTEILTRSEAIEAIQQALGNTEETAWVMDWTSAPTRGVMENERAATRTA